MSTLDDLPCAALAKQLRQLAAMGSATFAARDLAAGLIADLTSRDVTPKDAPAGHTKYTERNVSAYPVLRDTLAVMRAVANGQWQPDTADALVDCADWLDKRAGTFAPRPFDPRSETGTPDAETIAAVRLIYRDWGYDGRDAAKLDTPYQWLRTNGRTAEELRAMTWDNIRQAFAAGATILNQAVYTATNTLVSMTTGAAASEVNAAPAAGNERLPALKPHDKQSWQLSLVHGMTQENVAEQLNREHGTNYTQGQVSRMIQRAKRHAEASGLAAMVPGKAERPKTVDPSRLELGRRVDRRKPRPSYLARAENDGD